MRARACAVAMAFVCALYPVSYTAAQGSAETQIGFKHGKVMARQLVLGPNGKPIFAEFDQAGEVVQEIGEATEQNKLQGALVMPGSVFRTTVASYDELRQRYTDAVIMPRAQFEASTFALSQDANATLDRPPLANQVKTVLVRVSGTVNGRTLVPTHEFVLDTYPLLLPLPDSPPPEQQVTAQTLAVLIDSDGLVRKASNNNIGFRAAWISDTTSDVSRDNLATRQSTETPLGPVAGALVYVAVNGSGDITGADGGYSVQHMILPCPGSSYDIQNAVVAELRTQNFNPRGTYVSTYAVQVPFYITCYGGYANLAGGPTLGAQSAYIDSQAIMATQASISPPLDIKIDVMSLAGQGVLSNDGTLNATIPVAGETAYSTAAVTFNPFNPTFLDLNSDGRADQTFLCGENVKVYFDAPPAEQDPCVAQADVTRLADRPADYTDQGLLKSITETDLEQTDLYVFRVSNGRLISERKGLKPPTTTYQSSGISKNPDGSASNQFFYNMLLRGPRDLGSANPMNTLSFTEWQTRSGIKDPALLERKVDHLRVDEQIKIIAINRVTGYLGSVTTTLQNAAGNQSGALRIGADKIVLRPPNLRIKAERTSIVEAGLTKGEQRDYLIGFEGSALKSDQVIALSTEWVDADGSPLPDALPGYTARLAKVVDANITLRAVSAGGDVAEFDVKPGKRIQLVALPDDVSVSNDHFYLHVCGAKYADRSDCAQHYAPNAHAQGALRYRPAHYVPVRVPLYDEALTQLTKLQLRDSLNNATNDTDRQHWLDALRNADPNYRWLYRPEMQFSVFELKMRKINRIDALGGVLDILPAGRDTDPATIPLITSYDQQLQLLYDLVGSQFSVLPPFGPERELIFALGENELRAVVAKDQTLVFTNLDTLDKLQPEDFLSIRLYQNSDAQNILWEFAFVMRDIDIDSDNNNAFELPDFSQAEEQVDSSTGDKTKPSKLMQVNNQDDNDDDIPRFAEVTPSGDKLFVPIGVNLGAQNGGDAASTLIVFRYDASDPDPNKVKKFGDEFIGYQYIPAPGALRLWTKPSEQARNPKSVVDGGDWVPSEKQIPLSRLPPLVNGDLILYVESVALSDVPGDTLIQVKLNR